VFRANNTNLHWRFVESETVKIISEGLDFLEQTGYLFKSITIDGRKGVIQLLNLQYPGVPIQLCHFIKHKLYDIIPIILRQTVGEI